METWKSQASKNFYSCRVLKKVAWNHKFEEYNAMQSKANPTHSGPFQTPDYFSYVQIWNFISNLLKLR